MANDAVPANPPVTRLVQGSQAASSISAKQPTGKPLPASGQTVPGSAAATAAAATGKASGSTPPAKSDVDLRALIAHLNKYLNDSGQPNRFQVHTAAGGKQIQEVNPANGEVVGEYSAAEFPALARGLGLTGLVVDNHA